MPREQTIAAISTPLFTGGISVIRISGEKAIEIADRVFKPQSGIPLCEKKGYTASYGVAAYIDSAVATVFRAPKSYTGEDTVELSCHGGVFITREVLRAVLENGARLAEPGEFTKRAFLNGKLSLTQAEAVSDMIFSQNRQALNAAKAEMDGALWRKVQKIKESLLTLAGRLAAWVDYPEEDIPEITEEELKSELLVQQEIFCKLLSSYDTGKLFKEGIRTVIVGRPNVGKSTLMNLISGTQKSIVTEIAGTTRDVIEETVMLGEVMLRLFDTAGLRETTDAVEMVGVSLARKQLEEATLILAVFDSSAPLFAEDRKLIEEIKDRLCVVIINKTDLKPQIDLEYMKSQFKNLVMMSAKNADDADELERIIKRELSLDTIDTTAGMVANERQRECVQRAARQIDEALEALMQGMTLDAVTVSIEEAISAILELTGERVTTELVNQVFSHFCVGK